MSWTGSASGASPGGLDDRVGLPKRLAADFAADVHAFLPLSALANRTRVDDLRIAVEGLGGNAAGLRKAELVDLLTALYADTALIARVIAELPTAARAHLKLLAAPGGLWDGSWDGGFGLRLTGPNAVLVHAGLLLQAGYGPPGGAPGGRPGAGGRRPPARPAGARGIGGAAGRRPGRSRGGRSWR